MQRNNKVSECNGGYVSDLGNEWSPAISESEEETKLVKATLDFVVDEGGYSICGNERTNGGRNSWLQQKIAKEKYLS